MTNKRLIWNKSLWQQCTLDYKECCRITTCISMIWLLKSFVFAPSSESSWKWQNPLDHTSAHPQTVLSVLQVVWKFQKAFSWWNARSCEPNWLFPNTKVLLTFGQHLHFDFIILLDLCNWETVEKVAQFYFMDVQTSSQPSKFFILAWYNNVTWVKTIDSRWEWTQ